MAWTLLQSPLPLLSAKHNYSCNKNAIWYSRSLTLSSPNRYGSAIIAKAKDSSDSSNDDKDGPAFNPFGFVTDNPSSRSAIQLPESPAEDGNVGQMLYVS